jgi:hypothetical protein
MTKFIIEVSDIELNLVIMSLIFQLKGFDGSLLTLRNVPELQEHAMKAREMGICECLKCLIDRLEIVERS